MTVMMMIDNENVLNHGLGQLGRGLFDEVRYVCIHGRCGNESERESERVRE